MPCPIISGPGPHGVGQLLELASLQLSHYRVLSPVSCPLANEETLPTNTMETRFKEFHHEGPQNVKYCQALVFL